MSKVNKKGRNTNIQYIKLHRGITNSDAWKSLSCEASRLWIEIYARHNGQNNGSIAYSVVEARLTLKVGMKKVAHAFKDLQDRGFLICRLKGSFNNKVRAGKGKASEWEITTEPCDNQPAKALYRKWPEIKTR